MKTPEGTPVPSGVFITGPSLDTSSWISSPCTRLPFCSSPSWGECWSVVFCCCSAAVHFYYLLMEFSSTVYYLYEKPEGAHERDGVSEWKAIGKQEKCSTANTSDQRERPCKLEAHTDENSAGRWIRILALNDDSCVSGKQVDQTNSVTEWDCP